MIIRRLYLSLLPACIAFACTPRPDELALRAERLENRPSRIEARSEETVRDIKQSLAEREPALQRDREEILRQRDLDGDHDAWVVSELREAEEAVSQREPQESREIRGVVRAASADTVILRTTLGYDVTLRADESTEVKVLDQPVQFGEFLEEGAQVRASFTPSGDPAPRAESITVLYSAAELAE